jgi:N-acetylglucosaminyldiphosphoundecaprenol N-acetyl-beta-D-mannosaminyltransferase
VLGYKIAQLTLAEATNWCLQQALEAQQSHLVVTLNPEIVILAEHQQELKETIQRAELIVADGVGVLWASRQFGHQLPERIPGVELMQQILVRGQDTLRFYFLGAKPGIAEQAAEQAQQRYGTRIAGFQHGYFKRPDDVSEVIAQIRDSKPHVLFAGLGEGQELFLDQYRAALGVPLMMGVGGALDVLSGQVNRTPGWTRRLGLEWAYRVGLDRKRWHRIPRLLAFVRHVQRSKA